MYYITFLNIFMNSKMGKRTVFKLSDYNIKRIIDFGHYRYNEVKPKLEKHIHRDALEICFCINGQQHYKVGNQLFKLKGNDILVIPPNTEHSTGNYPEDKGELFWIQIFVDDKLGKLCNLPKKQSDFLINALLLRSMHTFKGAFHMKFLLESLRMQLSAEISMLSQITINQFIIQLILETVHLSKKIHIEKSSKRINTVYTYMQNNINRIVYVDELATIVDMSTGYFKSWFKSESGMPPKEYMNRLKIEQAKKDLLKKKSVTQVAFDLGFNSSQYFATTFKKFTGFTPKSFSKTQLPN